MPADKLTEIQTALTVVFLLVAPLAAAGLALMNAGLGRLRNAAHTMMAALCAVAVAAIAYFLVGRSLQGYAGGAAHVVLLNAKSGLTRWDWLGALPLFSRGGADLQADLQAW